MALALAPLALTGRMSAERDTSRSCVGRSAAYSMGAGDAGDDHLESSGQSRSSAVMILRASHTSAQRAVIAAVRLGDEDSAGPAEAEEEEERSLLGVLRGGALDLARSAAFLARWVA